MWSKNHFGIEFPFLVILMGPTFQKEKFLMVTFYDKIGVEAVLQKFDGLCKQLHYLRGSVDVNLSYAKPNLAQLGT